MRLQEMGIRLREERERKGLSQEEFGELGGVKKLAQHNYEKGVRAPDALYFSGLAEAGVDVAFVLTGQRPAAGLSPAEQVLLDNYRRAPPVAQANLLQNSVLLAAGLSGAPLPSGVTQTHEGDQGVQIGHAAGKVSVKRSSGKR